jgi:DNA-directed RNA polymerase specialized sigma subunit
MTNTIDGFHQLALANRSLINKVINKEFYGFRTYFTPENLSDLYGEGYLALYKAASRFQEEKGIAFATFA